MKKIGIIILIIVCLTLTVGCEKQKKETKTKETKTEVANPLIELSSKEELEKKIGFEVPIIEEKEIISYIAIISDKDKNHARILYQDGSEFDMINGKIKDQEEISGIYGSEEDESVKIKNHTVKIYKYEETNYGIWKDSNYTYCYSIQNLDIDSLKDNIELLIKD